MCRRQPLLPHGATAPLPARARVYCTFCRAGGVPCLAPRCWVLNRNQKPIKTKLGLPSLKGPCQSARWGGGWIGCCTRAAATAVPQRWAPARRCGRLVHSPNPPPSPPEEAAEAQPPPLPPHPLLGHSRLDTMLQPTPFFPHRVDPPAGVSRISALRHPLTSR